MMGRASSLAAAVGALALGVVATHSAQAAVVSTFTNANLGTSPLTISVGGGAGSLSFTAATTGYGPGAAVATGGNAMVTTIFGQVADFGTGSPIDGTGLFTFASYGTPSAIQYSAADDFVGFTYIGSDGAHFGYAEVAGPTLVGYAVESTAGTTIVTSQLQAVPEPASLALLASGVAGIGFIRRRRGGMIAAA